MTDNGETKSWLQGGKMTEIIPPQGHFIQVGPMKIRGFRIWSEWAGGSVFLPRRQTSRSAGYDIQAAETVNIQPGETMVVSTGLTVYMGPDEFLGLYLRSSIAMMNLELANGVGIIDADYEGRHIGVILRNVGKSFVTIKTGHRIAQGIFQTYLRTIDDSPVSETRDGGFGSTGR